MRIFKKIVITGGVLLLMLLQNCSSNSQGKKDPKGIEENEVFVYEEMQDSVSRFLQKASTNIKSSSPLYLSIAYSMMQKDTVLHFILENDIGVYLTRLYCVGCSDINGIATFFYCDSSLTVPPFINASLFDLSRADSLIQSSSVSVFRKEEIMYRVRNGRELVLIDNLTLFETD